MDLHYFLGEAERNKKSLNIWALIGIITFNAYFLTTVGIFLLFCILVIWTYISLFIISPLAYFSNKGQMSIYLFPDLNLKVNIWICLAIFVIGWASLPLAIFISKQVWKLTKQYIRYNIKSIYS